MKGPSFSKFQKTEQAWGTGLTTTRITAVNAQCEDRETRSSGAMWMLFLIIVTGVLARGSILFRAESMPGVNGAYSLVQARSLIEKGTLGLPDFPLLFALQAGFACLLRRITGWGLEPSILLAVKLCVALLPPLAAVPVFLLGRRWSVRAGRPRSGLPLVAAALVSFGGQAMAMTGNIDKNALALVWLSGMLLALHACMERRTPAYLAATVLFLLLLGVTHVGAFGAALVLAACVCAVYINRPGAPPLKVTLPAIAGALSVIGAAEGLVFWKFDPARIERLTRVITDPVAFMSHRPGSIPPMPGPMPPMPGGPPPFFMFFAVTLVHLALLGILAACVLRVLWKRRNALTDADIGLVGGSVLAIVLMTGPWVHGDTAMRLALIASLPAIVVAMFALLHTGHRRVPLLLTGLVCLGVMAYGVSYTANGGWRILNGSAYEEMKSLSAQIPKPEYTLIVANHGMEWNAAWLLHTHVAQTSALVTGDWQRYDEVLFLVLKDEFTPGGPPGFGLPGRPDTERGPRPGPEPGPHPPMHVPVQIPADAVILHDGPHLTLARVTIPPSFVKDRPETGMTMEARHD